MKRKANQEMHLPQGGVAAPHLSSPEQERMAALHQIMTEEWAERLILPPDSYLPTSCQALEPA